MTISNFTEFHTVHQYFHAPQYLAQGGPTWLYARAINPRPPVYKNLPCIRNVADFYDSNKPSTLLPTPFIISMSTSFEELEQNFPEFSSCSIFCRPN